MTKKSIKGERNISIGKPYSDNFEKKNWQNKTTEDIGLSTFEQKLIMLNSKFCGSLAEKKHVLLSRWFRKYASII